MALPPLWDGLSSVDHEEEDIHERSHEELVASRNWTPSKKKSKKVKGAPSRGDLTDRSNAGDCTARSSNGGDTTARSTRSTASESTRTAKRVATTAGRVAKASRASKHESDKDLLAPPPKSKLVLAALRADVEGSGLGLLADMPDSVQEALLGRPSPTSSGNGTARMAAKLASKKLAKLPHGQKLAVNKLPGAKGSGSGADSTDANENDGSSTSRSSRSTKGGGGSTNRSKNRRAREKEQRDQLQRYKELVAAYARTQARALGSGGGGKGGVEEDVPADEAFEDDQAILERADRLSVSKGGTPRVVSAREAAVLSAREAAQVVAQAVVSAREAALEALDGDLSLGCLSLSGLSPGGPRAGGLSPGGLSVDRLSSGERALLAAPANLIRPAMDRNQLDRRPMRDLGRDLGRDSAASIEASGFSLGSAEASQAAAAKTHPPDNFALPPAITPTSSVTSKPAERNQGASLFLGGSAPKSKDDAHPAVLADVRPPSLPEAPPAAPPRQSKSSYIKELVTTTVTPIRSPEAVAIGATAASGASTGSPPSLNIQELLAQHKNKLDSRQNTKANADRTVLQAPMAMATGAAAPAAAPPTAQVTVRHKVDPRQHGNSTKEMATALSHARRQREELVAATVKKGMVAIQAQLGNAAAGGLSTMKANVGASKLAAEARDKSIITSTKRVVKGAGDENEVKRVVVKSAAHRASSAGSQQGSTQGSAQGSAQGSGSQPKEEEEEEEAPEKPQLTKEELNEYYSNFEKQRQRSFEQLFREQVIDVDGCDGR